MQAMMMEMGEEKERGAREALFVNGVKHMYAEPSLPSDRDGLAAHEQCFSQAFHAVVDLHSCPHHDPHYFVDGNCASHVWSCETRCTFYAFRHSYAVRAELCFDIVLHANTLHVGKEDVGD